MGPFHRRLTDDVDNASIPYQVSVWVDSFPLLSDAPLPFAPLHRRSANRVISMPGMDLGGLDLPPNRHTHHHLSPTTNSATSPATGHTGTPSTSSLQTFVGSISAHYIAANSLASSGNDAVDIGAPPGSAFRQAIVLPIARHWRLRFSPYPSSSRYLPRADIAPPPPLKTLGSPPTTVFSPSPCGHVRLLCDQSSA